jgi:ribonuclease D
MGYSRLVQAVFEVELDKSASRSDWMRRPLSEAQCQYAADDVVHLIALYQRFSEQLQEAGLSAVIDQEYQTVLKTFVEPKFDQAYQRFKQAHRLQPEALVVLQQLVAWREMAMRERDLPRKRIASNDALLQLAKRRPNKFQQLFRIKELPAAVVHQDGELLLKIIEQASELPTPVISKPSRPGPLLDSLKQQLALQAQAAGIAEQMLLKKAWVEIVFWQLSGGSDAELDQRINGWRRPYYQQAYQQVLSERKQ